MCGNYLVFIRHLLSWKPDFDWSFLYKSQSTQLRIFKPGLEHSRGSIDFFSRRKYVFNMSETDPGL